MYLLDTKPDVDKIFSKLSKKSQKSKISGTPKICFTNF